MIYGYARCSTNELKQDIDRQRRELMAAGADLIRFEFVHGDSTSKPELTHLLNELSEGDTIITAEVSRLARSTKQLCEIIETIEKKKAQLQIIGSITIDCRSGSLDPMSKAFIQMAGVFSELELQIIRGRVKSGVENARAKGKILGRPKTTADMIPESFLRGYTLYTSGAINISELARLADVARNTAYKYIRIMEADA